MIAIEKMIAANRADCCGCYACYNACPFEAITMAEDEEGFRYPRVDAERCRNCGKCERTCPVLNPIEREQESTPVTYAAINKDEAVRADSSSGGTFHLLPSRFWHRAALSLVPVLMRTGKSATSLLNESMI